MTSIANTLAELRTMQLPPVLTIQQSLQLVPLGRATAYRNIARDGELIPGVAAIRISPRCIRIPTAALLAALGITPHGAAE